MLEEPFAHGQPALKTNVFEHAARACEPRDLLLGHDAVHCLDRRLPDTGMRVFEPNQHSIHAASVGALQLSLGSTAPPCLVR